MALTLGRYCWGVPISSTNQYMDINESGAGGAGVVAATIAAGTYDSVDALMAAVKTGMEVVCAGTITVTNSTTGKINIANTISFSLLWQSGATTTTSARHVLGYGAVDFDDAAKAYTATYQHHGAFYFKADGPDLADMTEWGSEHTAPSNVCEDGSVTQRPIGSTREMSSITIGNSPKDDMYSSTNRLQSMEDLYDFCMAGNSRKFRWYESSAVTTSWTTIHWVQDGVDFTFDPPRDDPGLERYTLNLDARKSV